MCAGENPYQKVSQKFVTATEWVKFLGFVFWSQKTVENPNVVFYVIFSVTKRRKSEKSNFERESLFSLTWFRQSFECVKYEVQSPAKTKFMSLGLDFRDKNVGIRISCSALLDLPRMFSHASMIITRGSTCWPPLIFSFLLYIQLGVGYLKFCGQTEASLNTFLNIFNNFTYILIYFLHLYVYQKYSNNIT